VTRPAGRQRAQRVTPLVLANGFFVATEFAIAAVRRSRLDQLVAEGRAGAAAAPEAHKARVAYDVATGVGLPPRVTTRAS